MSGYEDIWWRSDEGLSLYARDYAHPNPRATLLCMHGLTRNSADFEALCDTLHADYRLIAVDQRGRGRSEYDPNPENYHPGTYLRDTFSLLRRIGLEQVVAIGTSMGGLMTMMMAAQRPGCLQAAIINDIGPVVENKGLERIKAFVGNIQPVSNWNEAAVQLRQTNAIVFPNYTETDWIEFARRTCRETTDGRVELAYDSAIAVKLNREKSTSAPADLWSIWKALSSVPTLVIRGETSDILSAGTLTEMKRRKPDLEAVEVPGRGHAPMLNEPEALAAIRAFLQKIT